MIETQNKQGQWRCRFSSTLENIDKIDDLFAGYVAELKVPIDVFGLRILVREALLNAVDHGCGNDPSKTVDFRVSTDNAGMTLIVEDMGEGFDWRSNQGIPSDLSESGRGLALMRIYADNIDFNESGNVVTIRKNYKVVQPV